jgi:hypothetical protein
MLLNLDFQLHDPGEDLNNAYRWKSTHFSQPGNLDVSIIDAPIMT